MKKRLLILFTFALWITSTPGLKAHDRQKTLIVTMTNDANANAIVVVDADTHDVLQTLSTNGKGGASGNARGVKEYNYLSGTVAVFKRDGDRLNLDQVVTPTSKPVSIDFGNDHMYVAGDTNLDSFALNGNHVGHLDGTTPLVLASGALASGGTAQVGVADEHSVLVTIKTDPIPGTVDVIHLNDGAVSGAAVAVTAPSGTLTPFGFSVYPDGSAVITLAHSGHDGLFRNGAFTDVVVSGGQGGNCWTTLVGKYVFIVNTGSRTISRVVGTGSNIFVDAAVAANVVAGGSPTDTDADGGYLAVIDHTSGSGATSHLSVFTTNSFGELSASGSPIDLHAPGANGMSVMAPERED